MNEPPHQWDSCRMDACAEISSILWLYITEGWGRRNIPSAKSELEKEDGELTAHAARFMLT